MVSQNRLLSSCQWNSWHIQAPDDKIFQAETDFYILPTENIGKQQ